MNMEIGNVMHNGNHFYLDCNIRQYVILSHVERHIESCISIIFHYQIPRCSGSKVLCTSSAYIETRARVSVQCPSGQTDLRRCSYMFYGKKFEKKHFR